MCMQPNWTLSVEVPDNVNFTNVRNARIGRTRFNATEGDKRIPLTTLRSNQTLLGGHANNISMDVIINATSQACTWLSSWLHVYTCADIDTMHVHCQHACMSAVQC